MSEPTVFLASSSPRRAELLQQIGVEFTIVPIDVDESRCGDESVEDYVLRVAGSKSLQAFLQLETQALNPVVLGADTTIAVDGDIIGKPADFDQCQCILRRLSAREHRVLTAVAVTTTRGTELRLSCNQVRFRSLEEFEIRSYCETVEPLDKAGAYAIQGKAAVFISRLEGSYSSVMGLPLFETAELLQAAGIKIIES